MFWIIKLWIYICKIFSQMIVLIQNLWISLIDAWKYVHTNIHVHVCPFSFACWIDRNKLGEYNSFKTGLLKDKW